MRAGPHPAAEEEETGNTFAWKMNIRMTAETVEVKDAKAKETKKK